MRRTPRAALAGLALLLATTTGTAIAAGIAKPLPPPGNCRTEVPTAAFSISGRDISKAPSVTLTPGAARGGLGDLFYVLDAGGNPLQNVDVEFLLPSGAPNAMFGTGDASTGFTPSGTPFRAVVNTGDICYVALPLLVAGSAPGTFTIIARVVADPVVTLTIPVTIVAGASPMLGTDTRGTPAMVAPGGRLPGGVSAVAEWQGGPLAGVPITFTTPTSGATALFTNGTNTMVVQTDAFGMARADAFAGTTPGMFTVEAKAGTTELPAGTFLVAGSATIRLGDPLPGSHLGPAFDAAIDLPDYPCSLGAPANLADMVSFAVDGTPIVVESLFVTFACSPTGGGSTISASANARGLLPGAHLLSVALASSTPATRPFTLAPDFEGPSATGVGKLQLQVTDPGYASDVGLCKNIAAATGKLGDPGFPPTGPPGFDLPYGLVHFDGTACSWGNGWQLPPGPMAQRVALGSERPLSPTTTAWEYGPTFDNTQPHWHALRAAVSGTFAAFQVTAGPADVNYTLHKTVALAQAHRGEAAANFQDLWWVGPAENGWGMSITQHGSILFGALFLYDAQGNPTWLVMPGGQWNADYTVYTGSLYRPHGSPYTAYNAAAFAVGAPVGLAALTFDSDSTFTLDYTIDGVTGTKRLQRELFGPVESFAIAPLADLWWGGESQNGWGFALAQQYRTLFGVLFTYDAFGTPVWFVAPSGALQQMYSSPPYAATLYQTHGSPWLGTTYDPAQLAVTEVGSLFFSFQEGWDSGALSLTINGKEIDKPVVRQPF